MESKTNKSKDIKRDGTSEESYLGFCSPLNKRNFLKIICLQS